MHKITEVKLTNFQSLADVTIPLGGFTAIVGASNLGKSAVLRAIKTLARNAPATGLVREGAKELDISVTFEDGLKERLIKGPKRSEFFLEYEDIEPAVFAKAGAYNVPEDIAAVWAASDLSFTTQHDKPFMLAETPSEVAKTLGDLTNASMLMEAVREANRQRSEALNDAKARKREADECRAELMTHTGLNKRAKSLAEARIQYDKAHELSESAKRLGYLVYSREQVDTLLAESPEIKDIDFATVIELLEHTLRLTKYISYATTIDEQLDNAQEVSVMVTIKRSEVEQEIHNTMSEAGYCPLCGQGVI